MKFFPPLASLTLLVAGSTAAQLNDAVVYFRPEPSEDRDGDSTKVQELVGPDADPIFANFEGYNADDDTGTGGDKNEGAVPRSPTTNDLTFSDLDGDSRDGARRLAVPVAAVVAGFEIAAAAAPIVADLIKGSKKECQQLACWIATDSRTCAISVAERVQNEITKGRDRYSYETFQSGGLWARYWRTQFEPQDRGEVASGNCTNNEPFSVTNCQSTGRVHC